MSDKLADWLAGHAGRRFLDNLSKLTSSVSALAAHLVDELIPTSKSPSINGDDDQAMQVVLAESYGAPCDRHNMTLLWPSFRDMWSQTYIFRMREPAFYWFYVTIAGVHEGYVDFIHVSGDCGSDAISTRSKMTLQQFAKWIAHADIDYLLSKGDSHKEFDFAKARADFESYLIAQSNDEQDEDRTIYTKLLAQLGDILARAEYRDEREFYELVQAAFEEENLETSDVFADAQWGRQWSSMAVMRYNQIRYFGHWLLARLEVKHA